MKYRKLRIAWSVAWALFAVLIVALWVRSYGRADFIATPVGCVCGSFSGQFAVGTSSLQLPITREWNHQSTEIDPLRAYQDSFFGFRHYEEAGVWNLIYVPHWFAVLVVIAVGLAPWLPYSFSLRTLLIATTLVAVVLGAVVYAIR